MVEAMKLSSLFREEVVSVASFVANPRRFLHHGVVRMVDKRAKTVGLFLDAEAVDELREELEAASPAFAASLQRSRSCGRVSSRSMSSDG